MGHAYKFSPDRIYATSLTSGNRISCDFGEEREYDASAVGVICALAFFALLSLCGTLLEVYARCLFRKSKINQKKLREPDEAVTLLSGTGDLDKTNLDTETTPLDLHSHTILVFPLWMRLLMAFSVISNGHKVLNTLAKAASSLPTIDFQNNTVVTAHGIRFFSMLWIILGHTYVHLLGAPMLRPNYYSDSSSYAPDQSVWLQVVLNSSLSIDTFQLLSGKLVTYGFLSDWHKHGRRLPSCSSWVMHYVHRYLRIVPAYVVIVGATSRLLPLASDPSIYLGNLSDHAPACHSRSWWTTAFYLNNILIFGDQCEIWSWNLALDMQLYIITPLILYPVVKFGHRAAAIVVSVVMLARIASMAFMSGGFSTDSPSTHAAKTLWPDSSTRYQGISAEEHYCVKSSGRAGPYFIGMLLGMLLFHLQHHSPLKKLQKKLQIKSRSCIVAFLVWLIAFGCMLVPMYVLWFTNMREDSFSLITSTLYQTATRSAWAAGVAWILYMCETSRGGPISSLLGWSAFAPLSRLTYCAYLLHLPVILVVVGNTPQRMPFSHITCLVYFSGFLVMTYLASFAVSVTLEIPWTVLEHIWIHHSKSKKKGVDGGGNGTGDSEQTLSPSFDD